MLLLLQGGVEEGVKDIIEGEDPDTWLDVPGEEEEGEEGGRQRRLWPAAAHAALCCAACLLQCHLSMMPAMMHSLGGVLL